MAASTGAPAAETAAVTNNSNSSRSETRFGWRPLAAFLLNAESPHETEARLELTLVDALGQDIVKRAGERTQSHDLEIKNSVYARVFGLSEGKYEVKGLWRRNESSVFDRRFKLGRRGETVYGRRDAAVKAFALGLESEIDDILEHSVFVDRNISAGSGPDALRRFVDDTHDFIDRALTRRHSKSFVVRLERLARSSLGIPKLTDAARRVLSSAVQGPDIMAGFADIAGVFFAAGPIYTLVSHDEIPHFLFFDSASSEGPRLRFEGAVPSEATSLSKRKRKETK